MKFVPVLFLLLWLTACGGSEQAAQKHRDRATSYLQAHDYERARVEVANLLRLDPRNADDLVLAAAVYRALGNLRRAHGMLNTALDYVPGHADALVASAQMHVLARQHDEALQLLAPLFAGSAVPTRGPVARALAVRAAAYFGLGDKALAQQDLDAALALDPIDDIAVPLQTALILSRDGAQAAAAHLEHALSVKPSRVDFLALLVRVHVDAGQLHAAASVLERLLAVDPDRHDLRAHQAALLQRAGASEQGEATLLDGIAQHDSQTSLKLALVRHYIAQGRKDQALTTLSLFIDAEPRAFDLRIARAAVLAGLGLDDQARAAYDQIIAERPPLNWLTEATVGRAQFEHDSGQDDAAVATLNGFLETHANNASALALRARFLLAEGDIGGAVDDLEAALSVDRDSAILRFDLARLHMLRKEWVLAEVQLRQAIEIAPGLIEAREALVSLQLARNDLGRARVEVAKLLEVAPDSASALALAFDVERQARDWLAATAHAAALRERYPERSLGPFLLAIAYLGRDDPVAAERELQLALAIDPAAQEPLSALMRLYLKQDRSADASRLIGDTLAQIPEHPIALSWRGQLLMRDNKPRAAAESFRAALALRRDMVDAWRGLAAAQLGAGQTAQALSTLEEAIEEVPVEKQEQLSVDLTLLQLRRDNSLAAVAEAERYLRAVPQSKITMNNLAMILVEHEPYANSLARARVLVGQLVPSSDEKFVDTYALVMTRAGDPQAAIDAIDTFLLRERPSALLRYRRGIAKVLQGDHTGARVDLAAAVSSSPAAAFAPDARKRLGQMP